MLVLILADVALCAALVMVAAFVMVMRRRRRSGAQPPGPGRQRHGAVAGSADEGMAPRGTAVVPGFSRDIVEPDLGAHAPAEPDGQRAPATEPDGQRAPATEPDGQAAAGAITSSERIGSYYDAADRPIADYLAAHGWTEEPGTHDPG
jgi:hypothetical protein